MATSAEKDQITLGVGDFEYIGGLGRGAFGEVLLVRPSKQTRWRLPRKLMALKQQEKLEGCEEMYTKERAICRQLRGVPFLAQLLGSFQSRNHLYMLTDYYSGGSLQHHIENKTVFNGQQMAILTGELSLAVCFIHERYIVHRDIKPDNVMFDGEGHARIIDFGISCFQWDSECLQEPCGTSVYLAPEMYRTPVRYDKMVDFWAVGVSLLAVVHKVDPVELLAGPLKPSNDQQQCEERFKIPPGQGAFKYGRYSQPLKAYIQGLLTQDPDQRLGAGGEAELLEQPLFQMGCFSKRYDNWNTLKTGTFTPPLVVNQSEKPKLLSWLMLSPDDDNNEEESSNHVPGYETNFLV